MTEEQIQRTFADLFAEAMEENNSPEQVFVPEETLPVQEEAPAPETLPLIQQQTEPEKKLPLIFSERSPVPTRGGEPETKDHRKHSGNAVKLHTGFQPLTLDQIPDSATAGDILKLARGCAGYTLEQIREISHISDRYLVALEENIHKDLPLSVYVYAYLRTLGELYRLPADVREYLHELINVTIKDASNVPPELVRKVNANAQINEAEERRINRIFTAIAAVIAITVLLGIWAVVAAIVKHQGERENVDALRTENLIQTEAVRPAAPPVPFDQTKFDKLNAPRIYHLRVMETPR